MGRRFDLHFLLKNGRLVQVGFPLGPLLDEGFTVSLFFFFFPNNMAVLGDGTLNFTFSSTRRGGWDRGHLSTGIGPLSFPARRHLSSPYGFHLMS